MEERGFAREGQLAVFYFRAKRRVCPKSCIGDYSSRHTSCEFARVSLLNVSLPNKVDWAISTKRRTKPSDETSAARQIQLRVISIHLRTEAILAEEESTCSEKRKDNGYRRERLLVQNRSLARDFNNARATLLFYFETILAISDRCSSVRSIYLAA